LTLSAIYPSKKNPHKTSQQQKQQLNPPTWRKKGATTTVDWRGGERGWFYHAISNMSILVLAVMVTTNENLPEK
jgi:hypothetical protein